LLDLTNEKQKKWSLLMTHPLNEIAVKKSNTLGKCSIIARVFISKDYAYSIYVGQMGIA